MMGRLFSPSPKLFSSHSWVTHFLLLMSVTGIYHFVPDFLCLTYQTNTRDRTETHIMHNPEHEQAFCAYSHWVWAAQFSCCGSLCHGLLKVCKLHWVRFETRTAENDCAHAHVFALHGWDATLRSVLRSISFYTGWGPKSFFFNGKFCSCWTAEWSEFSLPVHIYSLKYFLRTPITCPSVKGCWISNLSC